MYIKHFIEKNTVSVTPSKWKGSLIKGLVLMLLKSRNQKKDSRSSKTLLDLAMDCCGLFIDYLYHDERDKDSKEKSLFFFGSGVT